MDCFWFQRRLRKIEYLKNVKHRNLFCKIYLIVLEITNHRLAIKLGLSIPKNIF